MTKLEDAMKKHMQNIVYKERRPFSFMDYLEFEAGGKKYSVARGTFRNKMNDTFKNEVEVICYTPIALYTLKGVNLVNPMTEPHTGDTSTMGTTLDETFTNIANKYAHICNHSLYKDIKVIPWGKQSIHDLRLRFEIPEIWNYLKSKKYTPSYDNKDICFLNGVENNIKFSVTVHKTDTISVSLGCTYFPIEIDVNGIMRLWNTLAIIEERMRLKVDCDAFHIPNHKRWIVTLWHFGQDALITYAGKKYDVEFGIAKEILLRIYTKEWNNGKNKNKNKKKVRIELQEYPMKAVEEAITDKISNWRR